MRHTIEIKKDMLNNESCDPSLLGWVVFFEFKCLYKLERYDDALEQAAEKLSSPYKMTANNAAFRASMCAELCVRAGRPVEQVIAFGTESFLRRVQGDNVLHTLQTLSTSCTLLELRDAEDKAEDFARKFFGAGGLHTGGLGDALRHSIGHFSEAEERASRRENSTSGNQLNAPQIFPLHFPHALSQGLPVSLPVSRVRLILRHSPGPNSTPLC